MLVGADVTWWSYASEILPRSSIPEHTKTVRGSERHGAEREREDCVSDPRALFPLATDRSVSSQAAIGVAGFGVSPPQHGKG